MQEQPGHLWGEAEMKAAQGPQELLNPCLCVLGYCPVEKAVKPRQVPGLLWGLNVLQLLHNSPESKQLPLWTGNDPTQ